MLLERTTREGLVTVKEKFQIVIPQSIREKVRLDVGDLLEAGFENGNITFTPKSVIDLHLAEGLSYLAAGRNHGPYSSAAGAIRALDERRPGSKQQTAEQSQKAG